MISRRLVALSACVVVVVALAPTATPAKPRLPDLDRIDPVRYRYQDAIVARALVPARDGLTQLALDIIRPKTSRKVPTIFLQSPYYNTNGRGYRQERKLPWGPAPPPNARGPRTAFPEWYDEYFVPRGYAVVLQDQRGTRNSSGCQVYGGREEITDAVDVIEWIARQRWSNGRVGMTGGSYDGTIAIGAASMAPEALKAIIPIRAISRWYDYHFFNGLQSRQHALTPWSFTTLTPPTDHQNSMNEDRLYGVHVIERKACAASIGAAVSARYSSPYQDARADFWASRDFLKDARAIRAATFIIHGLNDTNVKTTHAAHLWAALPERLPKKIWWLRGGHDDPANPDLRDPTNPSRQIAIADRFVEYTHRWFARFLKGIETGVLDEPPVTVQTGTGRLVDALRWPPPAKRKTFWLTPTGLSARRSAGMLTYLDSPAAPAIVLRSPKLRASMRIAGQAFMRLSYSLAGGGDVTFAYRVRDADTGVEIASGYARAAYRDEIRARGPSWPTTAAVHVPGRRYTIVFPFVPHDFVVPKGHRLELLIRSSDERTAGVGTGAQVTLHLDGSALVVPAAASRNREHIKAWCAYARASRCR